MHMLSATCVRQHASSRAIDTYTQTVPIASSRPPAPSARVVNTVLRGPCPSEAWEVARRVSPHAYVVCRLLVGLGFWVQRMLRLHLPERCAAPRPANSDECCHMHTLSAPCVCASSKKGFFVRVCVRESDGARVCVCEGESVFVCARERERGQRPRRVSCCSC